MAKPYSTDLRKRVVEYIEETGDKKRQVSFLSWELPQSIVGWLVKNRLET